jgi:hypothetical protein
MIGFNLSTNCVKDPEALMRRTKAKLKKSFILKFEKQPYKVKLKTRI